MRALHEYRIDGIKTSLPVHERILEHPDFRAGQTTTEWLEAFLATVKV